MQFRRAIDAATIASLHSAKKQLEVRDQRRQPMGCLRTYRFLLFFALTDALPREFLNGAMWIVALN